jgi:hypothetical protein
LLILVWPHAELHLVSMTLAINPWKETYLLSYHFWNLIVLGDHYFLIVLLLKSIRYCLGFRFETRIPTFVLLISKCLFVSCFFIIQFYWYLTCKDCGILKLNYVFIVLMSKHMMVRDKQTTVNLRRDISFVTYVWLNRQELHLLLTAFLTKYAQWMMLVFVWIRALLESMSIFLIFFFWYEVSEDVFDI